MCTLQRYIYFDVSKQRCILILHCLQSNNKKKSSIHIIVSCIILHSVGDLRKKFACVIAKVQAVANILQRFGLFVYESEA